MFSNINPNCDLVVYGVLLISNPAVFFLTVTSYSLFRFLRDFGHKKRQGKMPDHLFYEFHARQWGGTMILFSRISSQRALMCQFAIPLKGFEGRRHARQSRDATYYVRKFIIGVLRTSKYEIHRGKGKFKFHDCIIHEDFRRK